MVKHTDSTQPGSRSDSAALILGTCLALGSCLGIWFSVGAGEPLVFLMQAVPYGRASLVGSLSAAALPFLLSSFAVYWGRPLLLIPIAFGKAFFFSYVCFGVLTAWGDAGWLMAGLMCFGAAGSFPLLCWYWQRCLRVQHFEASVFWLVLGCLLAVGIIDSCLIVPFAAGIIN